jgi:Glyoxalase superfamily protein
VDAARAVDWCARLGFVKEWEHQFEPRLSVVRLGGSRPRRLYLSEHEGDARPDTLIHLYVRDVDAVSAEFGIPVDEHALAGRECELVDPDGNRLRVATRRS